MTQLNSNVPDFRLRGNDNGIPKTGLARRMRDWMAARTGTKIQRRFTAAEICEALNVKPGKDHDRALNTLRDFERRGELMQCNSKKHKRRHFLYVQDWQKALRGILNKKIYKAMHISGDFAVADLQRLTGLNDRNYIDWLVRDLREAGHIQAIHRRRCTHGVGVETVYHVADRDRFKLEVMR